ncbi:MAG: hypothetical protein LUG91_09180 [Ruminococcus sp.]|nr:hypothetical protein [Ruminococcus sp.]
MHRIIEYAEQIVGDEAKEKEFKHIVCEAMEKIRKSSPEEFYSTMYKLHCLVYGPHFDEHLAKKAVAEMRNVDGTSGEHWTIQQTNSLAMQHNIKEKYDFYYVINMLHSDFSEIIGNDNSTYAKLAKAYMCDPDAPEGKAFRLWFSQRLDE